MVGSSFIPASSDRGDSLRIGEKIHHFTKQGFIEIARVACGKLHVSLHPKDHSTVVERLSCETSFPLELVELFIQVSPFGSLCAWLARHEDDECMEVIRRQLLSYGEPFDYSGKRLLDFGCGTGASTFTIAAALPDTEVVGIDVSRQRIVIAQEIRRTYNISNTRFLLSPSPNRLPSELGKFDFITLNAVFEHLLPLERRMLLPLLWAHLNPAGILFINQTPYRYFPYEHHSTGLWFINYLPDRAAHVMARHFARCNPEVDRSPSWNDLLRGGIRGATEGEVRRYIRAGGGRAVIVQPCYEDIPDRGQYWLMGTSAKRFWTAKRLLAILFRWTDKLLGTVPSMNLDVALKKVV